MGLGSKLRRNFCCNFPVSWLLSCKIAVFHCFQGIMKEKKKRASKSELFKYSIGREDK